MTRCLWCLLLEALLEAMLEVLLAACSSSPPTSACAVALLQSSFWLTTAEGTVVLPTDAELAAADASLSNATTWKGCIWGNNVVYEGQVLSVLEGFESAEACCRACKADASSLCNVWNWCDPAASTNGTCSYDDTDLNHERVSLNASQCEWSLPARVAAVEAAPRRVASAAADQRLHSPPSVLVCFMHSSTLFAICLPACLPACRPAAAPRACGARDWQPASAPSQGRTCALQRWCPHCCVGA